MLLTAVGILATVIAVSVLAIIAFISHVRSKYRHFPHPPYNSLILGHLPELRRWTSKGLPASSLFHQWSLQCEKTYVVFLLHIVIVVVLDASMIKEILTTKSKIVKPKPVYKHFSYVSNVRCLGEGLLTETDHQQWLKRHNVIIPAFHKKYLTLFLEQFNDVGDRWISALNKVADGKTVFNMHDYLCRVTLDAIAEVGFNDVLNSTECSDNRFLVAILNTLKGIETQVRGPFHRFDPRLFALRRRAAESTKLMRSYAADLIKRRRQLISSGEDFPEDILTHIIKCQDVDPTLSDEIVVDDVMTLFIAGQETTSNALAFMFIQLGRHPHALHRLLEEVDDVMAGRTEIKYEDVGKLEYCGQVFKEILRLYPIVPGTIRVNAEDININGCHIPGGSVLGFSSYSLHRLPAVYDNPEEFRPERFARNAERPLYTYMPFSIGQRACAGQQFAKLLNCEAPSGAYIGGAVALTEMNQAYVVTAVAAIEAKVFMCKFFQNFDFVLEPNQSLEIDENATLRPKGGVRMTVTRRR